jgi:hypothetical protein
MNTPRLAVAALLSAFAAAPAFSQTAPLTPITQGPAGPGQCVLGSEGCGVAAGSAMDPISEAALVGIGQRAVPVVNMPAQRSLAEKKAPPVAAKTIEDQDPADLVAIGGQIINPLAGAATFKGASAMGLGSSAAGSRQATFDTHVDGSVTAAPAVKATGLSYTRSVQVQDTLTGKEAAFGSDPKLSAGDAEFGSGGFGASSNGSR